VHDKRRPPRNHPIHSAAASTVVNSLVYAGQLIYEGLVAPGRFLVDLEQAIADRGMRVLGQV